MKIQFSDNTIIHECRILGTVEALEVEAIPTEKAVEFKFDLLKNKEYFYFEIFFEPSDDKTNYSITSRINNIPPKIETLNYFDISWRNMANIFPVQMLMMVGLLFILDIGRLPHNKSNNLQFLPVHFEKSIYYKNEPMNRDSIVNYIDCINRSYQDNINKIFAGFNPDKFTELQRLEVVKKLDNNVIAYHNSLAKNSDFFDNYTKADSILTIKLSSLKNFYILFIEAGPYNLDANYSVSFKYIYKNLAWIYTFGILAYLVGAYFMFRYLRIGMRYKFIVEQIREYKKRSKAEL